MAFLKQLKYGLLFIISILVVITMKYMKGLKFFFFIFFMTFMVIITHPTLLQFFNFLIRENPFNPRKSAFHSFFVNIPGKDLCV